jgi:ribosomal 50S subunit-recycling heat shock protein
MRTDRWLFTVHLSKTRAAAPDVTAGDNVHINGERVKPSHAVQPSGTITFTRATVVFEFVVPVVLRSRGPAPGEIRTAGPWFRPRFLRQSTRWGNGTLALTQRRPCRAARRTSS